MSASVVSYITFSNYHHKKVQLTDIHFGPNLDVRHFGYTLTSKLNQLDIHFKSDIHKSKKNGCQTSGMIFGIECPHSLEMDLDVHFKTFQKWMSDILHVTFRKWMSDISKMDVRQKWMSDKNGCQTFQKWMSECQTFQR